MEVNRFCKVWFAAVAALMLLLPSFAACAKEAAPPTSTEPGEKVREILYWHNTDLSGPAAGTCTPCSAALIDVLRYVNDIQGGIPVKGGKIKIKNVEHDGGYNVDKEIAGYRRAVDMGAWFILTHNTAFATAVYPEIAKNKIIMIASPNPAFIFGENKEWFIGAWPTQRDMIDLPLKWWYDNEFKDKGKRAPVIGSIATDNEFGWMGVYGLKYICEREGYDLGPLTYCSPAPVDVKSQILTLKGANVDVVAGTQIDYGWIAIARSAQELGFDKQLLGYFTCLPYPTIRAMGPGGVGTLSIDPTVDWASDAPGLKLIKDVNQQLYGTGVEPKHVMYKLTFTYMFTILEAIRQAGQDIYIDDITVEDIRDALSTKITGYDPQGAGSPVSLSSEDRRLWAASWVVRINDKGTYDYVSDLIYNKPFSAVEQNLDIYQSRP